jgi:hypothetical protein
VGFSGTIPAAIAHFESLGLKCPTMTNPADFWLDSITNDFRSEELHEKSLRRIQLLQETWEERTRPVVAIPMKRVEDAPSASPNSATDSVTWNNPALTEFFILLGRDFNQEIIRSKANVIATFTQSAITTIIVIISSLFNVQK